MRYFPNPMILLIGVLCSIRKGYLYSRHMGSFICKAPINSSRGSQPVVFAIESNHHRNDNIRILSVDNRSAGEYWLIPHTPGTFKFVKGRMCETVKTRNLIVPGRCSETAKQEFIWVPEHMFERFVDRLGRNGRRDKHLRKKEKMAMRMEKHKIRDLNRSMKDIKGNLRKRIKSTLKGPQSKYSEPSSHENESKKPALYHDNILQQYLNYYYQHTPSVASLTPPNFIQNTNSQSNLCDNKPECPRIEGLMKNSAGLINQDFMKSLDAILNEVGAKNFNGQTQTVYQSKTDRPRVRGLFGKGEDPEDLGIKNCTCKFECVRNPKNGLCFFKATEDGKLVPILKSDSCCRKSAIKDPCNFENNIEKVLCELITRNDFSFFSKFLDQNYTNG